MGKRGCSKKGKKVEEEEKREKELSIVAELFPVLFFPYLLPMD